EERRTNAERKAALCEQVEALADSTDWEATATAIKQLQAEWKRIGMPPRAQSEALWQRFRGACDRFFDRRSRREEPAREAAVPAAEDACAALEALATSAVGAGEHEPAAEEIKQAIDGAWAELLRLGPGTLPDSTALTDRLRTACEQILAERPDGLKGS